MNTPSQFDVIVVYNGLFASSANDSNYTEGAPFAERGRFSTYNQSYAYFLEQCHKQGLRAAFATTNDIADNGLLRAVWTFDHGWKRSLHTSQARMVFDKCTGVEAQKMRALSQHGIPLFHHPTIRDVFDNKLNTFNRLPQYSLPTVALNITSTTEIAAAKKTLQALIAAHPFAEDFTTDYVLKDQYGAGGKLVFHISIDAALNSIARHNPNTSFVLQPFIDASGFHVGEYSGNIDLRVIVSDGEIVQSYLRIAKQGEFRANASQGGQIVYIEKKHIPDDVARMVKSIHTELGIPYAFYALDFMKSKQGHLYCIEGNSTPGLNWFDAEDEKYVKQLIRLIIKQIKKRYTQSIS